VFGRTIADVVVVRALEAGAPIVGSTLYRPTESLSGNEPTSHSTASHVLLSWRYPNDQGHAENVDRLATELGVSKSDNELLRQQLSAQSAELESGKLPAFKDRTLPEEVALLRRYFEDTTDEASDWPCLPECDSHGHRDGCPHVEPAYAFRKMIEELQACKGEVERLKAANSELEQLFDLIHEADIRGIKMWQAESPVERELTHPDKAKMVCWLMEQNDKLREENDRLLVGAAVDLSLIGEVNENAKNLHGMAKEILSYLGFSCDPFPSRTEVMNRATQLQAVEQSNARLVEAIAATLEYLQTPPTAASENEILEQLKAALAGRVR